MGLLMNVRNVPSAAADIVLEASEHYSDARPLTRYLVLWTAGRTLAIDGHLEQARRVLDSFRSFAGARDSAILRSAVREVEGHFQRTVGNWADAADCFEAVIEERTKSLPPRTTFFVIVGGHVAACRGLSGRPVGLSELRSLWQRYDDLGLPGPGLRLGTATAITLSARGHSDLAARFVAWSRQSDEFGIFEWFETELESAGLEPDPDAPPESLDVLLDELDALIADQW
jgi:hypothetical protein